MTSRCALYVDAGYLLAASATRVSGSSLRGSVNVDYGDLVGRLVEQAEALSGLPLLRVNWYDSGGRPGGQADHDQEVLGMLPRVKLRLGRRSPNGEQKGVDVRLGLDLATHGRNHVADVMFLVSGDDDLTEAVEEAQGHGVQVVVLAVPDHAGRAHAVARHLEREADGVELIHAATIDATVHRPVPAPKALDGEDVDADEDEGEVPGEVRDGSVVSERLHGLDVEPPVSDDGRPLAVEGPDHAADAQATRPSPADLARRPLTPRDPSRPKQPAAKAVSVLAWSTSSGRSGVAGHEQHDEVDEEALAEVCRGVYSAWLATAGPVAQRELTAHRPHIPGDIDRALLMDTSDRLGIYELGERTRTALRQSFWKVVESS